MMDLQEIASDRISELLDIKGFVPVDDVVSEIENLEDDMQGEDYCPYYSQHEEVINRLESDFASDAEDITHGQTFAASDYMNARAAYCYALVFCAFSSYFAQAKDELIEALREFESDASSELELSDEVQVSIDSKCIHGWASHDRELSDGTMIWESGQLDGCNGMARKVGSVWISTCVSPESEVSE